jgi:hypothetical protein
VLDALGADAAVLGVLQGDAVGVAAAAQADVRGLVSVLSYHLIQGQALRAADLSDGMRLNTALGVPLQVSVQGGDVRLMGLGSSARVTTPDVAVCGNGVVHIVDELLLPIGSGAPAPAAAAMGGGMMGTTATTGGAAGGGAAVPSAAASDTLTSGAGGSASVSNT